MSRTAIEVHTECLVDAPRDAVFLPLLLLLPGHGSFGPLKGQALFAGVEYLENEPSSSTADLTGPGANRRVPASAKVTFPLMAVQAHGHYVGLTWDRCTRSLRFVRLTGPPLRHWWACARSAGAWVGGVQPDRR